MPPTSTSTAVSSQAMNVQPPSENATPAAAPAAPTETSNGSITPAASAATALGTNGTAAETAAVVALKASGGSATTAPAAVVVKTEDAAAAGGATGEVKTEGEQQPQAQPRRKRMRRGGWDTPAVPAVPVPTALPAAALPVNPLQVGHRSVGFLWYDQAIWFCSAALSSPISCPRCGRETWSLNSLFNIQYTFRCNVLHVLLDCHGADDCPCDVAHAAVSTCRVSHYRVE